MGLFGHFCGILSLAVPYFSTLSAPVQAARELPGKFFCPVRERPGRSPPKICFYCLGQCVCAPGNKERLVLYCMKFSDLNLIPPILKAAAEAGYEEPSPIQQKAIPPVLAGRDLLGCAQTGTGKTAAFAMPILQRLASMPVSSGRRPIRALILTPTRELALQIDESFAAYGRHMRLEHCVIFGGVNQNPQVAQLKKGVDILTATPGRLNDLIGQGHIDLKNVEIFVLDEADRMLDMGFVRDVKRVLTYLPRQKQTLLFSATMPREIEELADGLLHTPEKVMVTPPATTVESIEQSVYFVDKANKRHLLAKLLRQPDVTSALVFTRTKHGADRVVRELDRADINAMAIHGNKSQNARQDALGRFKDGRIRVLVATDIAARGIDVSGLSHVFNYDLPYIPETYVHRIGRTGRAGHAGVAVSFCDFEEKEYLADIEKLTRIRIPSVEHEWPMQVFEKTEKPTQGRGQRAPRAERAPAARPAAQAQQPAPARKKPARAAVRPEKSEELQMEQTNTPQRPQQNGAAQDESAKRRRRRGGRRHKSGGQGPAAQAAQPKEGSAQAQPQPQPSRAEKPASGGAAPRNKGGRGESPERAPRAEKSAKPAKEEPRIPETDDSLQLIARKAPAQKYASFDDYMKAHED